MLFYTNYNRRKGLHLAHNLAISLTFVWHELERQVHIEGLTNIISNIEPFSFPIETIAQATGLTPEEL